MPGPASYLGPLLVPKNPRGLPGVSHKLALATALPSTSARIKPRAAAAADLQHSSDGAQRRRQKEALCAPGSWAGQVFILFIYFFLKAKSTFIYFYLILFSFYFFKKIWNASRIYVILAQGPC